MGVIEGKYGTLNVDLKIPDRIRISLRAYVSHHMFTHRLYYKYDTNGMLRAFNEPLIIKKWLKQSADLDATDPGTFYALGNWHYKVLVRFCCNYLPLVVNIYTVKLYVEKMWLVYKVCFIFI